MHTCRATGSWHAEQFKTRAQQGHVLSQLHTRTCMHLHTTAQFSGKLLPTRLFDNRHTCTTVPFRPQDQARQLHARRALEQPSNNGLSAGVLTSKYYNNVELVSSPCSCCGEACRGGHS